MKASRQASLLCRAVFCVWFCNRGLWSAALFCLWLPRLTSGLRVPMGGQRWSPPLEGHQVLWVAERYPGGLIYLFIERDFSYTVALSPREIELVYQNKMYSDILNQSVFLVTAELGVSWEYTKLELDNKHGLVLLQKGPVNRSILLSDAGWSHPLSVPPPGLCHSPGGSAAGLAPRHSGFPG